MKSLDSVAYFNHLLERGQKPKDRITALENMLRRRGVSKNRIEKTIDKLKEKEFFNERKTESKRFIQTKLI